MSATGTASPAHPAAPSGGRSAPSGEPAAPSGRTAGAPSTSVEPPPPHPASPSSEIANSARAMRALYGYARAMNDLRGKVAVVTGAASGIGRALAVRFAAEGMKLVL